MLDACPERITLAAVVCETLTLTTYVVYTAGGGGEQAWDTSPRQKQLIFLARSGR